MLEQKQDYSTASPWIGSYTELYRNDGISRVKIAATARFGVSCLSSLPGEKLNDIPCLGIYGDTSRLAFISGEGGRVGPIYRIPGFISFKNSERDDTRVYFRGSKKGLYVFDLLTRQGTELQIPGVSHYSSFAVAEPWLAVATTSAQGKYSIRVYKISGT